MSKREKLPLGERSATCAVDFLITLLTTLGIIIGVFNLLSLEVTFWTCVLAALIACVFVWFCALHWSVLPVLLVIAALVVGAIGVLGEKMELITDFVKNFWKWCITLFEYDEDYTGTKLQFLAEVLMSVPVAAIIYLFVRKLYSLSVQVLFTIGLCAALYYLECTVRLYTVFLLILALVASAPRVIIRNVNRKLRKEAEPGTTPRHLARYKAQLMAIIIVAVCASIPLSFLPKEDESWKSVSVNYLVSDIGDVVDYIFGNDGGSKPYNLLKKNGLYPLGNRLGGDIEESEISDEVTLRVTTSTPQLLKCNVYDTYTGTRWKTGISSGYFRMDSLFWRRQLKQALDYEKPNGGGHIQSTYNRICQDVHMVITYGKWAGHSVMSIERPQEITYRFDADEATYFNLKGELFCTSGIHSNQSYVLKGTVLDRSDNVFEQYINVLENATLRDSYYDDICDTYLQLPYTETPQNVSEVAAEITAEVEADCLSKGQDVTPYKLAAGVEQWLSENCTYTLTPGTPPEESDFVDYFLETREGYCTYYASAMTVLCRELGVPARLVTGYGLTQNSAHSNLYKASAQTAHAWTEIYLKGVGWLTMDPLHWNFEYELDITETDRGDSSTGEEASTGESKLEVDENGVYQIETGSFASAIEKTREMNKPFYLKKAFYIPFFIVLGVIVLFVILYLIYRFMLGHFLRVLSFKRVSKLCGNSTEACSDYYYSAIVKQFTFYGIYLKDGDTILKMCNLAQEKLKDDSFTATGVGRIIMRFRYGHYVPSKYELQYIVHFCLQMEERLRFAMGNGKYLWQRVILNNSKELTTF